VYYIPGGGVTEGATDKKWPLVSGGGELRKGQCQGGLGRNRGGTFLKVGKPAYLFPGSSGGGVRRKKCERPIMPGLLPVGVKTRTRGRGEGRRTSVGPFQGMREKTGFQSSVRVFTVLTGTEKAKGLGKGGVKGKKNSEPTGLCREKGKSGGGGRTKGKNEGKTGTTRAD